MKSESTFNFELLSFNLKNILVKAVNESNSNKQYKIWNYKKIKANGQLVLLDFGVTTFTSVAYQRSSLLRPLKENSSCGRFHA